MQRPALSAHVALAGLLFLVSVCRSPVCESLNTLCQRMGDAHSVSSRQLPPRSQSLKRQPPPPPQQQRQQQLPFCAVLCSGWLL